MELIQYKPEHLGNLLEQEATAYLKPYLGEGHAEALANLKYAYTMVEGDSVMGCAGLTEYWPGRAETWAILNPECKKHFLAMHNIVKRFLNAVPHRRIEAIVDRSFQAGHRWVKALGFHVEADLLKGYRPDGGDCTLYARVRDR